MKSQQTVLIIFVFILVPYLINAQSKKKKDVYEFKIVSEVKTTPVKNQATTGTCWSFATTSLVETELIRMGKGEHILSPIFNIRYSYLPKAVNYVRYAGSTNFGIGGQAHDVMKVIKEYGFIPEEIYNGMNINEDKHNHGEMDAVLKAIVDAVIKAKGGKITPRWQEVFESTLNIYLGNPPKEFSYKGKTYTPKSFVDSLGFRPEDYVELTSYSHHPFYTKFDLEIPDNWRKDQYYNVSINDLISIIDTALTKGYSVVWNGDTSEKEFDRKKGIATVPIKEDESSDLKKEEEEQRIKEKDVTQEMRQETFDNHTTTDDHLMHITGIAKDQTGAKFYYTKNSWGTKDKKYEGYWYMSEPYVRLKTIAIMVHKDAIPHWLENKLGM
ncbi:MAG: C1 family peptidase [Bacteroidota bacterium]